MNKTSVRWCFVLALLASTPYAFSANIANNARRDSAIGRLNFDGELWDSWNAW